MNHVTTKRDTTGSTDRLREHATVVGEDLQELGRLTGEAAREKLDNTKRAATEAYRQGQERVSSYVQSQPIRALGVAVAAGALLGFVLARRR